MKVTIDIEDLKQFYRSSSDTKEEWYGPENVLKLEVLIEFLRFIEKEKAAIELESFIKSENNE